MLAKYSAEATHVCRFIHQFTFIIVGLVGTAIVTFRFDDAIQAARRVAIARCGAWTVVLIPARKDYIDYIL